MSYLNPIYDVWGGNAEAMAKDIRQNPVTVRQWRNRGNIPPRYWEGIVAAAAHRGANLSLDNFLPPPKPTPTEAA